MSDDKNPGIMVRTGSVWSTRSQDGRRSTKEKPDYWDRYVSDELERREEDRVEQKREDNRARVRANDIARALAEARAEQVYVNGRLVTIYNLDIDGKRVTVETEGGVRIDGKEDAIPGVLSPSAGNRADYMSRRGSRQDTWDVLGIEDLDQLSRFIFSTGAPLNQDGSPLRYRQLGEMDLQERGVVTETNATNMMTLDGGVQWFRGLVSKDPDLYARLIDLLKRGNYLPEDAALPGIYTRAAGTAAAYAMADASENWQAGSQDDLLTFLEKAAQAADAAKEAAAAQAYEPVRRDYIDPAAIQQTARAAAMQLMGRGLTDEEAAAFASQFRGLEDSYFDQIDAAGRAGKPARVTDPQPSGQAEAWIRGNPEYDDDRSLALVGDFMDEMDRLFGRE